MNIHLPFNTSKSKKSLGAPASQELFTYKRHMFFHCMRIYSEYLYFTLRVVTGNGLMDSLYTLPEPPSCILPNRLIEGYRNFDVAFEPFVLDQPVSWIYGVTISTFCRSSGTVSRIMSVSRMAASIGLSLRLHAVQPLRGS